MVAECVSPPRRSSCPAWEPALGRPAVPPEPSRSLGPELVECCFAELPILGQFLGNRFRGNDCLSAICDQQVKQTRLPSGLSPLQQGDTRTLSCDSET